VPSKHLVATTRVRTHTNTDNADFGDSFSFSMTSRALSRLLTSEATSPARFEIVTPEPVNVKGGSVVFTHVSGPKSCSTSILAITNRHSEYDSALPRTYPAHRNYAAMAFVTMNANARNDWLSIVLSSFHGNQGAPRLPEAGQHPQRNVVLPANSTARIAATLIPDWPFPNISSKVMDFKGLRAESTTRGAVGYKPRRHRV